MKTIGLLFIAFCLAFCQPVFAQDKILLRTGDEMLVKVLEVSPDSVQYIHWADSVQNPKIQTLPKSAIFSVTYQNGSRMVMPETPAEKQQTLSNQELFELGRKDAQKNYTALGAYAGTFAASVILSPIAGLPTGAVLGFTKVPERNIKPSRPELLESPVYRAAYIKQAQKKKRTNAIAGFATVAGAYALLFTVVAASYGK